MEYMSPLFETLHLLDERRTPGEPAANMARDEALLGSATRPVLRVYQWKHPAVTFGYFLRCEDARRMAEGRKVMRRWTGGGIVEHGADFTWSLIVPADHPFCRTRPAASYGAIHGLLASAMASLGLEVSCVPLTSATPAGGLCFQAPAPGDVMWKGRKIAGAGQRRSRHGLLHQGSILGPELPAEFPSILAASLSSQVQDFPAESMPETKTADLVRQRYDTHAWLHLR